MKECMNGYSAPEARILVVDDSPINLTIVKGLLRPTKAQIDVAASGPECIGLSSINKYHIIFIDHMMPDMDGIEAFKHIRNDSDSLNKETPVVVFTANDMSGAKEEYISEGFADYLSKPINGEVLKSMVADLLPEGLVQPL